MGSEEVLVVEREVRDEIDDGEGEENEIQHCPDGDKLHVAKSIHLDLLPSES